MRLGQFARKFDLPITEIIDFLEEEDSTAPASLHPNAKLEKQAEEKLMAHFDIAQDVIEEVVELPPEDLEVEDTPSNDSTSTTIPTDAPTDDVPQDLSPAEEIAAASGEIAETQEKLSENKEEEKERDTATNLHAIETDELLRMLESEETSELEKIKLIKASKRELAGLKVLGKVDLPEPKKKEIKEEADQKPADRGRKGQKGRNLSDEEKEKQRLKAKRKREEYQARQEEIRRRKEVEQLKRIKEDHYRQKLEQKQQAAPLKKEKVKQHIPTKTKKQPTKEKPRTILGLFWRWLNT